MREIWQMNKVEIEQDKVNSEQRTIKHFWAIGCKDIFEWAQSYDIFYAIQSVVCCCS